MEKKKQENKMRRDQLNDEYLELLDKQRLYFKTVKDFKEVGTVHCTFFKHCLAVKFTLYQGHAIYQHCMKKIKMLFLCKIRKCYDI